MLKVFSLPGYIQQGDDSLMRMKKMKIMRWKVCLTLSRIATPFGDARGRGKTSTFLQTCYSMFFQVTPTFLVSFFLKYHKQSNGIKNKVIDAIRKKKMPSKV